MEKLEIEQIRVGTLSDKLSVARTDRAIRAMKAKLGEILINRVIIKSDDLKDVFAELAVGRIDVAAVDVAEASLIDEMPEGCKHINVAALLKRGDPRNVLIVPKKHRDNMPDAVIEGDVESRIYQLGEVYEGVSCVMSAAGNGLNSQMGRIRKEELDGIITSADAVRLLKLDHTHGMSYTFFEPERMVPEAGQAITALMTIGKNGFASMLTELNNVKTLKEYEVEQHVLSRTLVAADAENVSLCVNARIDRDNLGVYAYVRTERQNNRIRKKGKLSQKTDLIEQMVNEINRVVEY